jgi:hypothetical protein
MMGMRGGAKAAGKRNVIFALGDQMYAYETQALYTMANSSIRGITHWYNDRTQIDNGGGLGTGWGSAWLNPADTAFNARYALGECIHANFWLADVDAYAASPQFYNTDLPYVLSNLYFGHGPNYGECYVLLFSELQNTYDDGQPRYAERIRMSYLNAISTIRGMSKPSGINVRVGLGMGGYVWTGQTPDLSFWEPCIAASDFTAVQHMQDGGNYLSGGANIDDLIVRSVAQLGSYGKPVMLYQFELWGQDANSDPAWTKFVTDCLNNDAWMAARKRDGLFFFGLMQEPNINNTANEPTWTNAAKAMRKHRARHTAFSHWQKTPPAAATTAPNLDASSPAAVRTSTTTRTTASFTPPVGSLLVALVANNGSAGIQRTHTLTDSAGGTWIQRVIIGDNSGTDAPGVRGQAEIWVRKTAGAGAALTVTDTLDVAEGSALIVKVLTSANVADPLGDVASASGTGTAAAATLTTIYPNSLVIGVVSEWNTLAVGTQGTGCTVSDGATSPSVTSYILRRTSATTSPGSAALTTTAPTTGTEWNLAAAEFRGV